MMEKVISNVTLGFKGAYVENGDSLTVYLSRQGVTKTKNAALPNSFIEISAGNNGYWIGKVHYANSHKKYGIKAGQTYKQDYKLDSEEKALAFVSRHASKLEGKKVNIDSQTLHYCHGWKSYAYEDADLFLSPVFYCEYSDTVRHYPSNVCLVAFENGKFNAPILDTDKAAEKYSEEIKKALDLGFHSCDTKKGDDHCKRRLAWLVGSYIADNNPGQKAVFCNLDMTIFKYGNKEQRTITRERANELLQLMDFKNGGCLVLGANRPSYDEETDSEKAEIMKVWKTMPGNTCYRDAVLSLAR